MSTTKPMQFDKVIKLTVTADDFRNAQADIDYFLGGGGAGGVEVDEIMPLHRSDTRGGPIVAELLTDAEREALSWAHFDKQFVVKTYEDMAGKVDAHGNHIISGWHDRTSTYDVARHARWYEAMQSLMRFGLVEGYYEHIGQKTQDRVIATLDNGFMLVPDTGWRYKITELGAKVMHTYRALIYPCCDGCVRLNCVCSEKTFCAVHGGPRCHGSHD